jgi:serine/threonine protein kinase
LNLFYFYYVGCIIYNIITLYPPFSDEKSDLSNSSCFYIFYRNIKNDFYPLNVVDYKNYSKQLLDMVNLMMDTVIIIIIIIVVN